MTPYTGVVTLNVYWFPCTLFEHGKKEDTIIFIRAKMQISSLHNQWAKVWVSNISNKAIEQIQGSKN